MLMIGGQSDSPDAIERAGFDEDLLLRRQQIESEGLVLAVREVDHDRRVRAVILAGEGPTFCAGGDLKSFAAGGASAIDAGNLPQKLHLGACRPAGAGGRGSAVSSVVGGGGTGERPGNGRYDCPLQRLELFASQRPLECVGGWRDERRVECM